MKTWECPVHPEVSEYRLLSKTRRGVWRVVLRFACGHIVTVTKAGSKIQGISLDR